VIFFFFFSANGTCEATAVVGGQLATGELGKVSEMKNGVHSHEKLRNPASLGGTAQFSMC
jgi:hypothetical protein